MNRLTVLVNIGNDCEIIEFLTGKGIIKVPADCNNKPNCKNNPLVLRERNVGDKYWWRCTKCLRFTSIRNNSFLSKFNLPLNKCMQLIYHWSLQLIQKDICETVKICKQTLTTFFQEIRLVVVNDLNRDNLILGGPGVEVQIDESMFLRVKHNRGKDLKRQQIWVFGLIDVETNKVLFLVVPSRDAVTLLNIIYKHVAPRSIINSDSWRAYSRISKLDKNYTHKQVNHSLHFVGPDGTHTQKIESQWCVMKMNIKRMRGVNRDYLQSYLDEHCWRHNNGLKNKLDCFEEVCEAIGRRWKPVDNVTDLTNRLKSLATNSKGGSGTCTVFDVYENDDNFVVPPLPDTPEDASIIETLAVLPDELSEGDISSPRDISNSRDVSSPRDVSGPESFDHYVKNKIDHLVDIFEFPKTLTKEERAIVHSMAEANDLNHFSTGDLDNRFITIQRKLNPNRTPRRVLISNALVTASNQSIPSHAHVKIIVENVKSPKRRGRKPKSQSYVEVTSQINIVDECATGSYNLRSRNKAKN